MIFFNFSSDIRDLLTNPNDLGKRVPHRRLAEEATLLVHGQRGLDLARTTTSLLYETDDPGRTLAGLSRLDLKEVFSQATLVKLLPSIDTSVLGLALKLKAGLYFFGTWKRKIVSFLKGQHKTLSKKLDSNWWFSCLKLIAKYEYQQICNS